jgi:hypothetical protein
VFADRIGKRSRTRLFRQAEELEEEFPSDWPVTPRTSAADTTR